ncbi:hypothetical protein J1N35_025458 [Gossypium stocksii]|uniref:Uncharacterized protein n=1 Tax=Gossypium stocksii TaxID=47602 RepID=A0A9D3V759_9ROSI|nr:hypothetical protein J1N35_025458 [Gossypium stocksii]
MKIGRSSSSHPSNFKKPKDHNFLTSWKDPHFIGYKHKGFSKSTISMASSSGSKMVKGEYDYYGRNLGSSVGRNYEPALDMGSKTTWLRIARSSLSLALNNL